MTEPSGLARHVAAALLPFRVEGLISPQNRSEILRVAALLPAAASEFFGFECRLADANPSADFLACIDANDGQREAWLTALPVVAGDPAWQRLAEFVRSWCDPSSVTHTTVNNMWVEFDLAGGAAPLPSVFFGSRDLGQAQADGTAHAWHLSALRQLAVPGFPTEQLNLVGRCLAALPTEARLFQTGVMLSRAEPILRLCFRKLKPSEIPSYLGAIGWCGDQRGLSSLIREVAPLIDDIYLDIDVDVGVRPKIGLECYIDDNARLSERLLAFLANLETRGLCTPKRARALWAWYGLTHERWCRERWPPDLAGRDDRPGNHYSGAFLRTLHHIKLVYDPPAPLEAKAYLGCRFVWVDDVKLKQQLADSAAAG